MLGMRLTLLFAVVIVAYGMEVPSISKKESTNFLQTESSFRPYYKCSFGNSVIDTVSCAAARALRVVNEINKKTFIEILPGVTFNSNSPNVERESKNIKDLQLPKDPTAKAFALVEYLFEETARMISSRSLQFKLPESTSRSLVEGRGKMKKLLLPILLGIGAKVGLVLPVITGGVALLASKALIISKIALALGIVLLIPTLFSSGPSFAGKLAGLFPYGGGYYGSGTGGWLGNGGGYTPYGVGGGGGQWTTNNLGGGGYPYARAFNEDGNEKQDNASAQDLAYSGQK